MLGRVWESKKKNSRSDREAKCEMLTFVSEGPCFETKKTQKREARDGYDYSSLDQCAWEREKKPEV